MFHTKSVAGRNCRVRVLRVDEARAAADDLLARRIFVWKQIQFTTRFVSYPGWNLLFCFNTRENKPCDNQNKNQSESVDAWNCRVRVLRGDEARAAADDLARRDLMCKQGQIRGENPLS